MELTLSVRSFQTPETPLTCAWPPRRPSVPTSRATRVTSSAKEESWSTIVLTVCFSSSSSPVASTVTLRVRSPFATAVVTRAMSRTWPVRRLAIALTAPVTSRQRPDISRGVAWPPRRPSAPTSRASWVTSVGELVEVLDHAVDADAHPQDLAAPRPGAGVEVDPLAQVAVGDRVGDPRHRGRGLHERVDQRVGRGVAGGP